MALKRLRIESKEHRRMNAKRPKYKIVSYIFRISNGLVDGLDWWGIDRGNGKRPVNWESNTQIQLVRLTGRYIICVAYV